MTEPEASATLAGEPRWMAAAKRSFWEELKLYGFTLTRVIRSPSRFAAGWADGELRALNPLGFVATSAAVVGFLSTCFFALLGKDVGGGLVGQLVFALAPYLYYASVGVLSHLLLFSRVRRLETSIALSLYAGGAAAMLGMIGMLLPLILFRLTGHVLPRDNPAGGLTGVYRVATFALTTAGFGLFCAVVTLGLRTAHRTSRARAMLAVIGALLILGVAANWLPIATLHLHVIFRPGHLPLPRLMW